jgi:hypothetical protein
VFFAYYFSRVRKTIKHILVEYGAVAVAVYLLIFTLVLVGFWAAIRFGWQPTSAAGNVGTWTAAYIATKLTQPLRIMATLAVTPFIAKVYERVTGREKAGFGQP